MWALLAATWNLTGLNKLWPYLLVIAAAIAIIVAAYTKGQSSGTSYAKMKQLNDSLNTRMKEAKDRAEVQSINTADARKRLRDRWSSN